MGVFQAASLVAIWSAAETSAGAQLPPPFWAYAWPAGCALARELLDRPQAVAGLRVLDIGCGGGVAALAAARAGAAEVVANDVDPWALATLELAAARQSLQVRTLLADLTAEPERAPPCDVVLCADLAYERSRAEPQRRLLTRLRRAGARVLLADAERAYFDESGLALLAEHRVSVAADLEGVRERRARVYQLL